MQKFFNLEALSVNLAFYGPNKLFFFFFAGFYSPCSHPQVSNHLTLLAESLPSDSDEESAMPAIIRGNRNRCSVPGILYNTNTMESFHALDKQCLLKAEANKVKQFEQFTIEYVLQLAQCDTNLI